MLLKFWKILEWWHWVARIARSENSVIFPISIFILVVLRTGHQFVENASDGPHISSVIVVGVTKNDFWWTVVPAVNMLGKTSLLVLPMLIEIAQLVAYLLLVFTVSGLAFLLHHSLAWLNMFLPLLSPEFLKLELILGAHWDVSCQAKVTNVYSAIFVNEKIARFNVPMNYISGVHKIYGAKHVI